MLYNCFTHANIVLAALEVLLRYTEDELILTAWKGLGESGYVITNQEQQISAAFCQSAGGDNIVVYAANHWKLIEMSVEELDDIAEFFSHDEPYGAARYILSSIGVDTSS